VNLVKKVGPPFSQDSPETRRLERNAQNNILFIYQCIILQSKMKYVLLYKTFLVPKTEDDPSNDDFLLFKEENPFDTIDQQITGVYLSPILSQIDFLNWNRVS
jgi:hypothetical protein